MRWLNAVYNVIRWSNRPGPATRFIALTAKWEPLIALGARSHGDFDLEARWEPVIELTGRWE